MSKELKALERIEIFLKENCKHYKQDIGYIKEALQRLEAIDNTNPSEALKTLIGLDNHLKFIDVYYAKNGCGEDYGLIKNYILKAQEQEKVLSIIKEKNVKINLIKRYDNVHEYNECMYLTYTYLTQEEFDLLKRCVDDGN